MNSTELSQETIDELLLLARGNINLVEEALVKSLIFQSTPWWKFWVSSNWIINIEDAAKYIVDYNKGQESIGTSDPSP